MKTEKMEIGLSN